MRRRGKDFFFLSPLHWPPSLEPSIGHQVGEPSPSPSIDHQALDLPSFSFSFSLKGKLGSWELFFFPGHNFQLNGENTCSHKLLEEEKNDLPW